MTVPAKDRVAHGLCPHCGKEAAPYRLCYDCRFRLRINRQMLRGQRHGVLQFMGGANRLTKDTMIWKGPKFDDPAALEAWDKWQTPLHVRENDRRGDPRLRGIRIDVESTLIKVIEFIGRPATIEEIQEGWGRLRDKRSAPLAHDLGRIIAASDKRAEKNARRAAAWEKSQASGVQA